MIFGLSIFSGVPKLSLNYLIYQSSIHEPSVAILQPSGDLCQDASLETKKNSCPKFPSEVTITAGWGKGFKPPAFSSWDKC